MAVTESGSGSPWSTNLTSGDADLSYGVPSDAERQSLCPCGDRKCSSPGKCPAAAAAAPAPAPEPADAVTAVQGMWGTQAAVGTSAPTQSAQSTGATRCVMTKTFPFEATLHGDLPEQLSAIPRAALAAAFAFQDEAGNRVIDPSRVFVAGLSVEVTNRAEYGIVLTLLGAGPQHKQVSMYTPSGNIEGHVYVGAGRTVTRQVLSDAEILSEESNGYKERFTKADAAHYRNEVTNSRGVSKLSFFVDSPVFDVIMSDLSVEQRTHLAQLRAASIPGDVQEINTISSELYDAAERKLLAESSNTFDKTTDLTQLQFHTQRADGLNFNDLPAHISSSIGTTQETSARRFSEKAVTVDYVLEVEYAQDVKGSF